jgi:hypothetical protein
MNKLTQSKHPIGLPALLEITSDGYPIIPDHPLQLKWLSKRDVYQSFVKLAWRRSHF